MGVEEGGRGTYTEVFPQAEEEGQGLNPWVPHRVGVTETHKTWSDIYWGSGASSPLYSTLRLIGFQCGTLAD